MIHQTILSFELEETREGITSRAGLATFGEFIKGVGVDKLVDGALPSPENVRGYYPSAYVSSLLLMFTGGGRSLEDIRQIREDRELRSLLGMKEVPGSDACGKWLRRMGLMGYHGLETVNRHLVDRYLKRMDEEIVLDIDATIIEAGKQEAAYTYKKTKGYSPMVGHITGGFVICEEFRDGNIAPADENLSFIRKCARQLADSAGYQADILNYCDENGMTYTIGGRMSKGLLQEIEALPEKEWIPLYPGSNQKVASFLHTMPKAKQAFRIVVTKTTVTPVLKGLEGLIGEETLRRMAEERYHLIATNDFDASPGEIKACYNQRGETSDGAKRNSAAQRGQNRIKELKSGFGLEYLPTGDTIANALWFRIGTLAYNLFLLFKTILDDSMQRQQVQTLRWRLLLTPGKVVSHARSITLKVSASLLELFRGIRANAYAFAVG